MSARVYCTACEERYGVDKSLVGMSVRCRNCGTRLRVSARRQRQPAPTVNCPYCGCEGEVEPTDRRVTLACPECEGEFHVRFVNGRPAVTLDRQEGPPRPRKRLPNRKAMGFSAFLVAGMCFLGAVVANNAADQSDRREATYTDSANRLSANLAYAAGDYRGLRMREASKTDRTWVYVLVMSGVVFTACGMACFATAPPGYPDARSG